MDRTALLLLLVSTLLASCDPSLCAKDRGGAARRQDIPYIECAVCQHIATQLHLHLTNKRSQVAPKQLSEFDIIELTENICNLKKPEAEWMLHLDIVEDGDSLKLEVQEQEGECRTECKTIQRACEEVLKDQGTDLEEFLYKKESEPKAIIDLLCNDLSEACSKKIPPIPKDREPGEPFIAKSSKDAEMERIMRSMGDMPGAPNMKMYSRENLMNSMPDFDGDDEDDDDFEDEEDLHKGYKVENNIQRNTLHQAYSLINTVKKTAQHATITMQKHIRRITDLLGKWWSGKHEAEKKSSNSLPSDSKATEL